MPRMTFSPIPVDPWSFFCPRQSLNHPPLALPPARCVFEAVTRFEAHRRCPYAVPRNINEREPGTIGASSQGVVRVRSQELALLSASTRISNDETHFRI